ncbi:probable sirohydrochlorin cobaltochelatase [Coccomyxa sp. Obi]|nr:probable sirohydrochlorin cobaltochelatase [Coccomyxa sp. Obi]
MSAASQDEVAVVLVDHGSKRTEANDMLEEFAALYRTMSNRQRVEIAHMELAEPSIGTAVAKCASDGIKKVVIAPYFLSRGRHITSDIPALVAEAQRAHPELECIIAEPIGIDPLMAQVIENRVTGALRSA